MLRALRRNFGFCGWVYAIRNSPRASWRTRVRQVARPRNVALCSIASRSSAAHSAAVMGRLLRSAQGFDFGLDVAGCGVKMSEAPGRKREVFPVRGADIGRFTAPGARCAEDDDRVFVFMVHGGRLNTFRPRRQTEDCGPAHMWRATDPADHPACIADRTGEQVRRGIRRFESRRR